MHGKGAVVKNRPASAGDLRDMVQSLGQEDPLDKEMATHSVFLPGKFNGQRSLAGYSPLDHKESDTIERLTLSLSSWRKGGGEKNRFDSSWACFSLREAV